MIFHKCRGQIYKVELTSKEQKALDEEITRQLKEKYNQLMNDVDYMIMRILHNEFGFGQTRLKRFYDAAIKDNEALIKHYEMNDAGVYIARKEMNDIGCNIEEWNRERGA
jgi:uncharacterized protein YutD